MSKYNPFQIGQPNQLIVHFLLSFFVVDDLHLQIIEIIFPKASTQSAIFSF